MPRQFEAEILDKVKKILQVLSLQVGADKGITERARLLRRYPRFDSDSQDVLSRINFPA